LNDLKKIEKAPKNKPVKTVLAIKKVDKSKEFYKPVRALAEIKKAT